MMTAAKDCAMSGIEILNLYSQVRGQQNDEMFLLVKDLLVDLMHACDMEGVCKFADCLQAASEVYVHQSEAETETEVSAG